MTTVEQARQRWVEALETAARGRGVRAWVGSCLGGNQYGDVLERPDGAQLLFTDEDSQPPYSRTREGITVVGMESAAGDAIGTLEIPSVDALDALVQWWAAESVDSEAVLASDTVRRWLLPDDRARLIGGE